MLTFSNGAPIVAAVVVTWNSATTIERTLTSLASQDGVRVDAIVVDNCSSDDTVARAAAHPSAPRIIRNTDNRGLAAANNQGLLAARHPWTLICNPDIDLQPDVVRELLAAAERHPRAGFLIPRLVNADGTLQTAVGDLPRLSEALLGRDRARRKRSLQGIWWDGWDHREERLVGHGQEACYLVRQDAVEQVGGQDERYWLDWEGLDWSARLAAADWEIWFCPTAEVMHTGGVSIRQAQARWIRSSHRAMYLYFSDRSPSSLRPVLGVLFAGRALTKLTVLALRGNAYSTGEESTP